jgi:hypothetical protein
MFRSRFRHGEFTGLVAVALSISSILLCNPASAVDEMSAEEITQRVQDWQPTRDERLLDQIGWASDLVEAKRLALEHKRPLFVFTYSGSSMRANAIALQRC